MKNILNNENRALIEDSFGLLIFGYIKDDMYIFDGSLEWKHISNIKNYILINELKDKLGWNE